MDWRERLHSVVLSTIVRDFPEGFWADIRTGARQAYLDVFHQVDADPNLVSEQRIDTLFQVRHFRMEHLLTKISLEHGIPCSATILAENNRHYVYSTKGDIALTQVYVPAIGAMPKPARFRERLAAINDIMRSPRLDLGDEPREVLLGKRFYGLLAHNPAGKRFVESDQRLGMIQFCLPVKDCSDWAMQLTIEEIAAAYKSEAPSKKPDRRLPWKKRDDEEKGEEK